MNAVIYCRVSSKDQVDGTSLDSQEFACREYAKKHGINVARVFMEEGESAKFADRTQLLELLAFCKSSDARVDALVIWKIDRFARNVEDHYTIKAALKKVGVQIISVTEPIQADPNGQLLETILAGFAQFDNDIRAIRARQGMQQRIREGIWPWKPPLGYLPPKMGKKTRPDQPDPSSFQPMRKAWRLLATGAYRKADIARLLQSWGVLAYRGRSVSRQILDYIFENPYYSGVLRDPWTNSEHPGRHVPMVTKAEFARVQQVLADRSNSQPHHQLTQTFPLRGHVRCPTCRALMTGYFAKGKRKRYPYYKCFNRVCPTWTKSYAAAAVNDEFAEFLADTAVSPYLAKDIIREWIAAYCDATEHRQLEAARIKKQVDAVNRQLQELISMRATRLVSDEEFVVQSEQFRRERSRLLSAAEKTHPSFTEADLGEVAEILSDLEATWGSLPSVAKRSFTELLFPAGYVFRQVRTTEKGLLFRTVAPDRDTESNVVRQVGENLNTLNAEISRLLAITRHAETAKERP